MESWIWAKLGLGEGIAERRAARWRSGTNLTHDFHSPLRGIVSFDLLVSCQLEYASLFLLYLLLYCDLFGMFSFEAVKTQRVTASQTHKHTFKNQLSSLGKFGFLVSILNDSSQSKCMCFDLNRRAKKNVDIKENKMGRGRGVHEVNL